MTILATQKNVSPRTEPAVFSADLAARVYELYREDFTLFGYAQESWHGM